MNWTGFCLKHQLKKQLFQNFWLSHSKEIWQHLENVHARSKFQSWICFDVVVVENILGFHGCVSFLNEVAGGSFIYSAHVTYLVWVKQTYSQSINLTHELILCIQIPRGRVDFLTKIPKLKVLAGTEFLTLKKLVKCIQRSYKILLFSLSHINLSRKNSNRVYYHNIYIWLPWILGLSGSTKTLTKTVIKRWNIQASCPRVNGVVDIKLAELCWRQSSDYSL